MTLEYFPLKLILYDFGKPKKQKKKLIKRTKRLLFFLAPTVKSINFLLNRSYLEIFDLSFDKSDVELTARLYNVAFSAFVFIFHTIKKKGTKKYV